MCLVSEVGTRRQLPGQRIVESITGGLGRRFPNHLRGWQARVGLAFGSAIEVQCLESAGLTREDLVWEELAVGQRAFEQARAVT